MSFDLYFTASPYASSDLLPSHPAQPPVVSAIRDKGFEHCAAGQNDATGLDNAQRVTQTNLKISQVLQSIWQKATIVSIARQNSLGFGQIANVRSAEAWVDVETISVRYILSKLSCVRGSLYLQDAASDLSTMLLQKPVEIVSVDRRSPIKPVMLRKRTWASKIAPNRQSFPTKNATQPGGPPWT